MNKTDRLLAIVLELQGKGRRRAEDLAATFETSKRTIYRDIEALCEAGVPIVSTPGQGYSLMKGYFLPPLSFTSDEATMLLLGGDLMAQSFDSSYRAAALSAMRKIEGVLPEKLRAEVYYLQSSIRFVSGDAVHRPREISLLQCLRRAIIECSTVRFCYYTRHRTDGQQTATLREADPYGLIHITNAWYLVAYCHLRRDIRHFRLDRIDELELLAQTFQRPANFAMRDGQNEDRVRSLVVRVLFDAETARWVREARSYYTVSEEDTPHGLLVTLHVRQESEIFQWLLSWGRHVTVLEPASLREMLRAEAEVTLQQMQTAIKITHTG